MFQLAERYFETSVERSVSSLQAITKHLGKSGLTPEALRAKEAENLRDVYRSQIRTVLAIFCLMRNVNAGKKVGNSNDPTTGIPDDTLKDIAGASYLDPNRIVEELNLVDEKVAVSKVRAMLEEIHSNCKVVGEKLGVKFIGEKRDIA